MKTKSFYKSYIPDDWTHPNFGSIFKYLKTFPFSRECLTYSETCSDIQYIHYGDIHSTFKNEVLDFEVGQAIPSLKEGLLNKEHLKRNDFPYLKDGDLVIADASEDYEGVCKCVELKNIGKRKIISGLHTMAVRADENIMANGFRTYALKHPQVIRELSRIATGISVYSVSKSYISKILLPLPPISEQKKIAACLYTWDRAISVYSHLIYKKELGKKWLMQVLLTKKKRLKGFDDEWIEVTIGDIFCRITRKNTEDNTNVMTISAQKGFVRQTDFFTKTVASESLTDYFLIEKGEFCYNKSYSNGYDWGATKRLKDFNKAVVTTLYICFKLKNEDHSGDFFEQYFECNLLNKGLTKIAHEGGRAHGLLNVTPHDFFSLKIKIPSKNEQIAIANVLNTADRELLLLRSRLEKIKDQKRGLMQVLLTGEKRFLIK